MTLERFVSGGKNLEPYMIILGVIGLIFILLLASVPAKTLRFVGQGLVKLMIGALFLFFLNVAGNQFGIYVPINFVTSTISGFLGIPGVAALAMLQLWVL